MADIFYHWIIITNIFSGDKKKSFLKLAVNICKWINSFLEKELYINIQRISNRIIIDYWKFVQILLLVCKAFRISSVDDVGRQGIINEINFTVLFVQQIASKEWYEKMQELL